MFRTALKEYLVDSTFHGLKFIALPERHWIERIFWVICVLVSWYGSLYLIQTSWIAFVNNPINFGIETTYLDWNTHFPSVAVCEDLDGTRLYPILEREFPNFYNEDSGDLFDRRFDLEEVFTELVFFVGSSYYVNTNCFQGDEYDEEIKCPTGDYRNLVQQFRMNCTEMFHKCSWNDVEFDCCTYFLPLETEYGTCYAMNNMNTRQQQYFDMVSNSSTGPGTLALQMNSYRTKVYVLSKEDVPHLTSTESDRIKVPLKCVGEFFVKVNAMENEPEVKEVSIAKRKCRFPDENYLDVYPVYSSSACLVNCRKNIQLEKCNCTTYFMPGVDPKYYCNLTGLLCLGKIINMMRVRKTAWSTKEEAFYCPCDEGCETTSVSFVRWLQDLQLPSKSGKGELYIILDHLPTELFKRTVVRGKLDLVVSMGGAAGLFVGASLLSFAELVYHFTIRLFVTVKYLKKKYNQNNAPSYTNQLQMMNIAPPVSNFQMKNRPVDLQQLLAASKAHYAMPPTKMPVHAMHYM